ncbi:MAG: hypothetical protein COV52_05965 [Gammaproteobacteria bacterium CG11_big_fil_rev_8_21_14_0_20_46_22]|nr:MAG: hypothetical protein COW05_07695 [Gammaproteobacteria bacterium CG12_big_fil_rev_8_21_14_0_65_46_12]PIR11049.1 MAG: hypothetical protein COV52_05965 [Gammaproteobacteria bacterium CG11_big_fil_rev_8_21_14_0_20_46_22]
MARLLLKQLGINAISFVGSRGFDLIKELRYCSEVFAGLPAFLLPMFTQNTNHAVLQAGKRIVLSGTGGDECVSSRAPATCSHASTFRQQGLAVVWRQFFHEHRNCLLSLSTLKKAEKLFKAMHPAIFFVLTRVETASSPIKSLLKENVRHTPIFYKKGYYKSVRAYEWDHLQGSRSDTLRWRIEYHAMLGDHQGLEYRYPLLYPKLVEFCFHLPEKFKRRDRVGRYLVREYLKARGVPQPVYSKTQKTGASIPATIETAFQYLRDPIVRQGLKDLPWFKKARRKTAHEELIAWVYCYMLNHYPKKH